MEYESLFKAARKAGTALADVEPERLGRILQHAARLLRGHTPALLEANARDIEAMPASSPMLDRLRLTPERIGSIASDMEAVSHLRSPQGEELARWTRPNGMTIVKRRVPFGVVGMVCEARPNVTADIFALCVKTGNACVLKGGSDARHSNEAIAALLHEALGAEGIDENTFTLLPAGHEAVGALLSAVGYVDVVIPRGGAGLIRFVRENARIPVIETGAGIVHTYFDIDGDLEKGRAVVCNAKTRRVSVCNALDCLVIHRGSLTDLPELCAPLAAASRPSHRSTGHWRISPATRRATARPSSPKTSRPPRSSRAASTPPASTSTSRPPSPTAGSSASAPKWVSRRRNSTPAARWDCPSSRPTSISSRATDKSANLKPRYDKKPRKNGRKNNNP